MANKAHAATLRRLSERYGLDNGRLYDLMGGDLIIEVETAATVADGIRKLLQAGGRRFVAMTNQESVDDALLIARTTEIGVMSPKGDIVKEAGRCSCQSRLVECDDPNLAHAALITVRVPGSSRLRILH